MSTPITKTTTVIDVTDQTFAAEVLDRSYSVPVVVDFWAAWCGPCRMLGPILEKLVAEYQGKFILAKVDVDSNQGIAGQFHVQGIPAVKAFVNGEMFKEFTGALPEPQVREFLNTIIPSEADLLDRQGFDWEVNDQPAMAITHYRAALEKQADHTPAKIGLGRVLLSQGNIDEGIEILNSIPLGAPGRDTADALLATAEFQKYAAGHTEDELKAAIETDPNDVASRYALAGLYATQQKYGESMDQFLEVIRRNRKYNDDGARKAMLALFATIGEDQQIVKSYRQKLANVLF